MRNFLFVDVMLSAVAIVPGEVHWLYRAHDISRVEFRNL